MPRRAVSLVAAACLDIAFGEPPAEVHLVVFIGRALSLTTDRHRGAGRKAEFWGGAAALAATSGLTAGSAKLIDGLAGRTPGGWLALGAALKPFFAVRMLLREAGAVASALEQCDVAAARGRLWSLVSRATAGLGEELVAAAAIESLAENLADSVIAPWLYFAGFGLPGAAVYRVVNTADSMYGYRDDREWLGKAAAKTDDILSWLPSRLAAAGIVAAAWLRRGPDSARSAWMTWQQDGASTASPNAGRPMAAMAGALGRRLEKHEHYILGAAFPEPSAADIRAAIDVTSTAAWIALAALAGILVVSRR